MKKITETIVETESLEEYVVNGEGCQNDCPKKAWVNDILGCGDDSAFLSTKR